MLFGLEVATVAALALLAAGVVGSAIPSIPGPLLSLGGVAVYWLGDGTDVGTVVLAVLAFVAAIAVVADWLAGSLAAKYGGASWTASILGGVVGFVLLFAFGPLAFIVGLAGTIFAIEAYRKDRRHATKAATYSTIGALGSIVVQVLIAFGMLVTFGLALTI